jgi:hypothetical protein
MNDFQERAREMDKWSVVTRVCLSLEQAEEVALDFIQRQRTTHITLWPMRPDRWMLIARLPVMVN